MSEENQKQVLWEDCGVQVPNDIPVEFHPSMRMMDSSKLQAYQSCPRKFFYQYVLGLQPEDESIHLVFGEAWHRILAHLYQNGFTGPNAVEAFRKFQAYYNSHYTEEQEANNGAKTSGRAMEAMLAYMKEYALDAVELIPVAIETGGLVRIGETPILPDYEPVERFLTYRIDALMRRKKDNRVVVLEHKTASRGGPSWDRQWLLSLQVGTYTFAVRSNYQGLEDPNPVIYVNGTMFCPKNTNFQRVNATPTMERLVKWNYQVNAIWDNLEQDYQKLAQCSRHDKFMGAFVENTGSCSPYSGCAYHDLCLYCNNPLNMRTMPVGMVQRWWNPLADM